MGKELLHGTLFYFMELYFILWNFILFYGTLFYFILIHLNMK